MTFQISVEDFRKAVTNMKSNIAVVKCADHMFASIQFLTKKDGTPYYTAQWQVGNVNHCYAENFPVIFLVKEFNEAMREYSEKNY